MGTPDKNGRKEKRTNFESIEQADLPSGRRGKHHKLLAQVLEDLQELADGRAIKIPLSEFAGSVADLRSAITRATSKMNLQIATSSDEKYFYLWKPTSGESSGK